MRVCPDRAAAPVGRRSEHQIGARAAAMAGRRDSGRIDCDEHTAPVSAACRRALRLARLSQLSRRLQAERSCPPSTKRAVHPVWAMCQTPPPSSIRVMAPLASTTVDLARIQFATTSIYHFLFVPLTLGLAPLVAIMQTLWYRTQRRRLAAADALLRHAAADQLRDRGGDRPGAGVPVRDELVGVLELRRRGVRRAAGDRGPGRVHARGDVPRALDLRLEPAAAPAAPGDDLDRGAGAPGCRPTSSSWPTRGCSTRSATRWSTARRS